MEIHDLCRPPPRLQGALRLGVGGPRYSMGAGAGADGWRARPEVCLEQSRDYSEYGESGDFGDIG